MENNQTYLQWCEIIINEGRHLTKWEENFAYDMQEILETNRNLSEKQAETLERIYSEKTPN